MAYRFPAASARSAQSATGPAIAERAGATSTFLELMAAQRNLLRDRIVKEPEFVAGYRSADGRAAGRPSEQARRDECQCGHRSRPHAARAPQVKPLAV